MISSLQGAWFLEVAQHQLVTIPIFIHMPAEVYLMYCAHMCGNTQVNVTGDATMGTVTGFSPFTVYSCTIFAVTVADGPESDPLVVRTAEGGVLAITMHSDMCYYPIQFLVLPSLIQSQTSVIVQCV